ncbi:MAG: DUF411 domain-containing protein [Mariprofundales bacterium]
MKHKLSFIKYIMAGILLLACTAAIQAPATEVKMYKDPNCGCCADWADHLRDAGFKVTEINSDNMPAIKAKYGVPVKLASCHTAIIGDYIIEGHVPAQDIKRLLQEKTPSIHGLAAPGMPAKSPGMQAKGLPPKNYDVMSFDATGKSAVFHKY